MVVLHNAKSVNPYISNVKTTGQFYHILEQYRQRFLRYVIQVPGNAFRCGREWLYQTPAMAQADLKPSNLFKFYKLDMLIIVAYINDSFRKERCDCRTTSLMRTEAIIHNCFNF